MSNDIDPQVEFDIWFAQNDAVKIGQAVVAQHCELYHVDAEEAILLNRVLGNIARAAYGYGGAEAFRLAAQLVSEQ